MAGEAAGGFAGNLLFAVCANDFRQAAENGQREFCLELRCC
jgi:hypothetical protein